MISGNVIKIVLFNYADAISERTRFEIILSKEFTLIKLKVESKEYLFISFNTDSAWL